MPKKVDQQPGLLCGGGEPLYCNPQYSGIRSARLYCDLHYMGGSVSVSAYIRRCVQEAQR